MLYIYTYEYISVSKSFRALIILIFTNLVEFPNCPNVLIRLSICFSWSEALRRATEPEKLATLATSVKSAAVGFWPSVLAVVT